VGAGGRVPLAGAVVAIVMVLVLMSLQGLLLDVIGVEPPIQFFSLQRDNVAVFGFQLPRYVGEQRRSPAIRPQCVERCKRWSLRGGGMLLTRDVHPSCSRRQP
jgi:hypothetical protein